MVGLGSNECIILKMLWFTAQLPHANNSYLEFEECTWVNNTASSNGGGTFSKVVSPSSQA